MLKARVIKKSNCEICSGYMRRLDKMGFDYETYDTDEGNVADMDAWRIADLPVIQIVDEHGKVHYQWPYSKGGISPRAIRHKIKDLEKNV